MCRLWEFESREESIIKFASPKAWGLHFAAALEAFSVFESKLHAGLESFLVGRASALLSRKAQNLEELSFAESPYFCFLAA